MKTSEIKTAIAYGKRAEYDGSIYTVHGVRGYKIPRRRDIGYSVELLDKNTRTLIYAPIGKVKLILEEN